VRLRIATLNVWALPWGLAPYVEQRIRAIGERLGRLEADVVAFQEVWTRAALDLLVAAGRRSGLEHVWYHRAGPTGSGLLVLSRLPIAKARFEVYRVRGRAERVWHGDHLAGKGFGELLLETSAGPLAFVDTHLHAQYAPDGADDYRWHRMAQLVQLAAGVAGQRAPLVAAGDFNLREDQPHHGVLTGLTGLRDAAASLGRREPTLLTSNPYQRSRREARIDYVFVRDGKRHALRVQSSTRIFDEPLQIEGRSAAYSDHAGLLVDLALVARAGGAAAPQAEAVAAARRTLEAGREQASRRRRDRRLLAGTGLSGGALALVATRSRALTRRRLLRRLLAAGGALSFTSGLAAAGLAEIAGAEESRTFGAVIRQLDGLDPASGSGATLGARLGRSSKQGKDRS
jgi:endonuclease/exonuclease/phosphatase family metal-dependent hydrolase